MNFFKFFIVIEMLSLFSNALKLKCEKNYSKYKNCIADGFDYVNDEHLEIYCDPDVDFYDLVILPNQRSALKSGSHIILKDCSIGQIVLNNFRSLSVETTISIEYDLIQLYFYNSDFVFESFETGNFTPNLFNLNGIRSLSFRNDIRYFKQETSPLVFKNSFIIFLEYFELANSSFKTNYFEFKNETNITDLNSNIKELHLFVYKLTLSSKILNELVFEKLEKLIIYNQMDFIEPDTFKSFKNLKYIFLDFYSLKYFFHKGTKWLKSINYAHRNENSIMSNKLIVSFAQSIINTRNSAYSFPDIDFCLFNYFSDQRQVELLFDKCVESCTFFWLVQNSKSQSTCANFTRLNCNFEIFLEKCQGIEDSRIDDANNDQNDEFLKDFHKEKRIDFVLSILVFPIVCVFGCSLNILNILVLSNKKYKKQMQQPMYKLMLRGSFINFLVCLIYLFRLTIKCIDPINSYCPISLITNKTFRYSFLTLVNYFGNVLKTVSNLIQIPISIDRIRLSTQARFALLQVNSQIKMKYMMLLFFVFSFAVNFIKIFQYDYNLDTLLVFILQFCAHFLEQRLYCFIPSDNRCCFIGYDKKILEKNTIRGEI